MGYFKEIEERAPICEVASGSTIYDPKYQNDNHTTILKILYSTIKDTQRFTHIKKFQKK